MEFSLKQKLQIRFERGEYFGPFFVDAICHHIQENRFTYSLVKTGETQPTFWFDSTEIVYETNN